MARSSKMSLPTRINKCVVSITPSTKFIIAMVQNHSKHRHHKLSFSTSLATNSIFMDMEQKVCRYSLVFLYEPSDPHKKHRILVMRSPAMLFLIYPKRNLQEINFFYLSDERQQQMFSRVIASWDYYQCSFPSLMLLMLCSILTLLFIGAIYPVPREGLCYKCRLQLTG